MGTAALPDFLCMGYQYTKKKMKSKFVTKLALVTYSNNEGNCWIILANDSADQQWDFLQIGQFSEANSPSRGLT